MVNSLSAMKSTLSAIAPEEVDEPRLPMATALQEANDLWTLASDPKVGKELVKVGLNPEAVDRLREVLDAAREAQSQWTVSRDASKSQTQVDLERRSERLRADILSACRWSLRFDRVAKGTLSAIATGEGVADLTQDLIDLAELITRKRDSFTTDSTFDAGRAAEEARALATELAASTSTERLVDDQASAKDLRNRAYTLLDDLVAEIREAGQYAFRNDARLRQQFTSSYLRRRRRRSASEAEPQVPVSPENTENS
jgi:hypothetical protein